MIFFFPQTKCMCFFVLIITQKNTKKNFQVRVFPKTPNFELFQMWNIVQNDEQFIDRHFFICISNKCSEHDFNFS